MRYRASHEIRFSYTAPVFLEPHTIRLRPRSNSWQRLECYEIELDPKPALLAEAVDAEGNDIVHAWFSDLTDSLVVRTEFEVETLRTNPFDYLELEGGSQLPVQYPSDLHAQLGLGIRRADTEDRSVSEFANSVADRTQGQTLSFLKALSEEICKTHEVTVRLEGDPRRPAETLRVRGGACRDLAVLFMDCCRLVGIASRFVSGYQAQAPDEGEQHMHAWAEVYLPGGGWRGYDPTHGLAVSDRHIAVAASSVPRLAAPTSGTFRGAAGALPMKVDVRFAPAEAVVGKRTRLRGS